MSSLIHPSAICESSRVGAGTRVGAFSRVLAGAVIGLDCELGDHVSLGHDVRIGDRVLVRDGARLCDGLRVRDDVRIGPNATFVDEKFPSKGPGSPRPEATQLEDHCSVGAGAVILPGLRIGAHALIGAGAVVTHDVPPYAIVVGNPARIVGYTETVARESVPVSGVAHDETRPVRELGVPGVRLYRYPRYQDLRGHLTVTDMERDLPFRPSRYFLVHGVSSQRIRGEHAHKVCEQLLICVAGSIHLLVDDGRRRQEITLSEPNLGVYLPPMIWGTQFNFSQDARLLVFASHPYDPGDYIRDYREFLDLKAR